ncbi:uncharacterized protein [Panulirus ornatus]|uniref:uncharacterized protein n=1 Tax=Panulirus ornatus TaxID=150431 RepID=UPI003A889F8A
MEEVRKAPGGEAQTHMTEGSVQKVEVPHGESKTHLTEETVRKLGEVPQGEAKSHLTEDSVQKDEEVPQDTAQTNLMEKSTQEVSEVPQGAAKTHLTNKIGQEEGEAPQDAARTILTEESVRKTLEIDKGSEAQLLSWQIKNFTKKGDNYACEVTSVVVQYAVDGVPREKTYVAKMNRVYGSGQFLGMMQTYFVREGTCYLEIFPRMSEILERYGHHGIRIPKAYYGSYEKGKEVLLLEDLRAKGFRMYDRRRGLDVPHATLVLQELGRMHAASILLERSLPNRSLNKTWDVFSEPWLEDENVRKMFQSMVSNQLEGAAEIVEKVPNYEHVVKWIRNIKDEAVETYFDSLLTLNTKFSVLIHGDCWTNNFLFRYDAAGVPIEVMLVDLQYMRQVSPVLDLNYFLYSSFDGHDRKTNFQAFLSTYYDSFKSVLEAGGAPVPFTYEELRREFNDNMMFGCLSAIFLVPTALSEDDDVVRLEDITDDNMDTFSKDRQQKFVRMSQRAGSALKDRLLDTFEDMIEAEIICERHK